MFEGERGWTWKGRLTCSLNISSVTSSTAPQRVQDPGPTFSCSCRPARRLRKVSMATLASANPRVSGKCSSVSNTHHSWSLELEDASSSWKDAGVCGWERSADRNGLNTIRLHGNSPHEDSRITTKHTKTKQPPFASLIWGKGSAMLRVGVCIMIKG